jgi:hypothetical protein
MSPQADEPLTGANRPYPADLLDFVTTFIATFATEVGPLPPDLRAALDGAERQAKFALAIASFLKGGEDGPAQAWHVCGLLDAMLGQYDLAENAVKKVAKELAASRSGRGRLWLGGRAALTAHHMALALAREVHDHLVAAIFDARAFVEAHSAGPEGLAAYWAAIRSNLLDPDFVSRHWDALRWHADGPELPVPVELMEEMRLEAAGAAVARSLAAGASPTPTFPPGRPRRMTLAEANEKAMALAANDPSFVRQSQREWASRIGCSVALVDRLPLWRETMKQTGRGKRARPPAPKTVSLTPAVEAVTGTEDAELQRLIEDQQADSEPSPLEDDPPGTRPRTVHYGKRL